MGNLSLQKIIPAGIVGFLSITFLAVAGCFSNAFAAFEFHPRFTLSEEYNDNLYLADDNEQEDWITIVSPGFQLTYDNRSVDANIDYFLQYKIYKNHSEENQDEFKDVQRAKASILLFGGKPFTLQMSETISRDQLDDSERYADYNDLVNRSTVYRTSVTPQYRQSLGQTMALVFGYTYNRVDWVDAAGDDTQEHIGRVSLEKTLSTATTISGSYAYRIMDSDAPEDEFDRQDYSIGLRHQLGKRTSVSGEIGYSTVEYDTGYDTDSTTWNVSADYQLSAAFLLSLYFSQDFSVSATDGLTKTQEAGIGLDYKKDMLSGSGEIYWAKSDYVRLDRKDTAYGLRVEASDQLSNYFTVNVNGDLEFAEYQELGTDEDVYRYSIGSSVDYTYRRFLISCGYRYRVNNSDKDANDYTNNVVTLGGTVRF